MAPCDGPRGAGTQPTTPQEPVLPHALCIFGITNFSTGKEPLLHGRMLASYVLDPDPETGWKEFKTEAQQWHGFDFNGTVFAIASRHYSMRITTAHGLRAALVEAKEQGETDLYLSTELPLDRYNKPMTDDKASKVPAKRSISSCRMIETTGPSGQRTVCCYCNGVYREGYFDPRTGYFVEYADCDVSDSE